MTTAALEKVMTPVARFFSHAQALANRAPTLTKRAVSLEAKKLVQELRRGATREQYLLVCSALHELEAQLTQAVADSRRRKPTSEATEPSND